MTHALTITPPVAPPLAMERACALLAECRRVDSAREIRDQAKAIAVYLAERKAGAKAQNEALEIVLRADRRVGQIIRDEGLSRGGRPRKTGDSADPVSSAMPTLAELGLSKRQSATAQALADLDEDEFLARLDRLKLKAEKLSASAVLATTAASDHDGDAWETPDDVLELARQALGGNIDLDPASSAKANRRVRAGRFFDARCSALDPGRRWRADRAWLNPPYSAALVGQFMTKLLEGFRSGDVKSGAAIVNACTETPWFQALAGAPGVALCLPARRIAFLHPRTGEPATNNSYRQAMFFLGCPDAKVRAACEGFGVVLSVPIAQASSPIIPWADDAASAERSRKAELVLDTARKLGTRNSGKIARELAGEVSRAFAWRVLQGQGGQP